MDRCYKNIVYILVSGYIMTKYLTILLLLITLPTLGQSGYCFCSEDSSMNEGMFTCDTTILSNNAKLYWQYNCDRIWLTLENANGQKIVIDEASAEIYDIFYRGSFQLIKEFNKSILFQNGCPANGPCIYTLIDKNTGNKIEEFDQLICIDTEDGKYNFDFIVYLSDTTDHLIIYYVDSNKTLQVPFEQKKLKEIVPEYQFEEMSLNKNILTLLYVLGDDKKRTLNIDLNDKKYSR